MDLRVRTTSAPSHKDEALVLLLSPEENPSRVMEAAGSAQASTWEGLLERKAFEGKPGQVRVLTGTSRDRYPLVVVAGTGKPHDADVFRQAMASAVRQLRELRVASASVVLPTGRGSVYRTDTVAGAVAEGAITGLYRFQVHKKEKQPRPLEALTFLAPRGEAQKAEKGVARGRVVGEAVNFARDLGNEPGNRATPTYLAETALEIAGELGLDVTILEEEDMARLGMGALLGVSKGSAEPAKLIVLTYEPPRRKNPDTVAIVGKGLTFDAGGINIKPSPKMEDMKFDMCGGAAVLATMSALPRLNAPVRVVGLVPSSENLLGAAANKPGDILTAMNGTTIEIKNTDAEGRLILADALCYATAKLRPRPKAIIDLATLTGACVVALGDQRGGLLGNNEGLVDKLLDAGETSGDRLWRLPLDEGYKKQLESTYADISNLGSGPGAGTITAAAFLEKFVGKTAWAHLDIAGTAWTEKTGGYLTKGATGFGVRVLCQLLGSWRR
jgi:leucyl aminopeptidase